MNELRHLAEEKDELPEPQDFRLDDIMELQSRSGIRPAAVQDLMDLIEVGQAIDPAHVFVDRESNPARCWMSDGHHRLRAYRNLGRASMPCRVFYGNRLQALIAGLRANRRHTGERLSNADKAAAIQVVLRERCTLANGAIAGFVGCDPKTVAKRREEMIADKEVPICDAREGLDGKVYVVRPRSGTQIVSSQSNADEQTTTKVAHANEDSSESKIRCEGDQTTTSRETAAESVPRPHFVHSFPSIPNDLRARIESGSLKADMSDIDRLAELQEQFQREIVAKVDSGQCRTIRDALYDEGGMDDEEFGVNLDSEPSLDTPLSEIKKFGGKSPAKLAYETQMALGKLAKLVDTFTR
jgi:hypothetical protein